MLSAHGYVLTSHKRRRVASPLPRLYIYRSVKCSGGNLYIFVCIVSPALKVKSWVFCKYHVLRWVVPRLSDIRYCFSCIQVAAFRYNPRPRHYIRKIVFPYLCPYGRVRFHAYTCVCTFPGIAYAFCIPHPFNPVDRRAYLGMDSGSS